MTAKRLFFRRCVDNFRFQLKAWRLGIDWTVFIYMLVPAVIFTIAVYRSWWIDLPNWMTALPFEGFLFLSYVFAWFGTVRLFVEEADELFLLQKRSFYQAFRKLGILYSIAKLSVGVSLFIGLFLPYLILKHQFSGEELLQFFVVLTTWKTCLLFVKDVSFFYITKRWFREITVVFTFLVGYALYAFHFSQLALQVSFFICIVFLTIFLYRWKTKAISHFYAEVERELEAKYRIVSFLIMHSGAIEKQRKKSRKKPWIFRSSNRLFSRREFDTIVMEQYVKAWFRKPEQLFSYFRFLGLSAVVMMLFPSDWSILLLLLLLFLCYQMIRSEWESFEKSPLIQTMVRDREALAIVKSKVISVFALPVFLVLIFMFGFLNSTWLVASIVFAAVFVLCLLPWFLSRKKETM